MLVPRKPTISLERKCFMVRTMSCVCLLVFVGAGFSDDVKNKDVKGKSAADLLPKAEPKNLTFRLVNITIPCGSPHRQNKQLNDPPRMFLIVKVDGEPVGQSRGWVGQLDPSSTHHRGWSVDFPKNRHNKWKFKNDDSCISLELWDFNHLQTNTQILSITQLHARDLKSVVFEDCSKCKSEERVRVLFKRVNDEEDE